MSELGDVLELLYGARGRYRSARATIREWRHTERAQRAMEQWMSRQPPGTGATMYGVAGRADEPKPEATVAMMRVWYEPPSRYRQEYDFPDRAGETSVSVWDGRRTWMYAPSFGAIEQEAGGPTPDPMLDPAGLIPTLDLAIGARTQLLGREAIEVRAVPRPSEQHGFILLDAGADEHRLLVDVEQGVLLRVTSFVDGEEYVVREVVEIGFDEVLPCETFTLALPPGEEIRSPADLHRVEHVSIEEAVRRAPFTVLVPARSPEGFALDIIFIAAQERPRTAATVVLSYVPNNGTHRVSIREAAEGELELLVPAEPEVIERDGVVYRVVTPGTAAIFPRTQVFLDRDGTSLEISSDLDLETLLELAASLAPASAEPPRLV